MENQSSSNPDQATLAKPPPIFVKRVKNVRDFLKLLDYTVRKGNYSMNILNDGTVKVQVLQRPFFNSLIRTLDDRKWEYYTLYLEEYTNFRVFLRNIPARINPQLIVKELKLCGHDVEYIKNIRDRKSKRPLPLFYLELSRNSNNNNILTLKTLSNRQVKFEKTDNRMELPQCLKCQAFGHGFISCEKPPACVRCASSSWTNECPCLQNKTKSIQCVNCGGEHPANFRCCPARMDYVERTFHELNSLFDAGAGKKENLACVSSMKSSQQQQPKNESLSPEATAGHGKDLSSPQNTSSSPSSDRESSYEIYEQLLLAIIERLNLILDILQSWN